VGLTQRGVTWYPRTNPFGAHTGINSERGDMGSMDKPIWRPYCRHNTDRGDMGPMTNPFRSHSGVNSERGDMGSMPNSFGAHTGVNSERGEMGPMDKPIWCPYWG